VVAPAGSQGRADPVAGQRAVSCRWCKSARRSRWSTTAVRRGSGCRSDCRSGPSNRSSRRVRSTCLGASKSPPQEIRPPQRPGQTLENAPPKGSSVQQRPSASARRRSFYGLVRRGNRQPPPPEHAFRAVVDCPIHVTTYPIQSHPTSNRRRGGRYRGRALKVGTPASGPAWD
jgi:hypothetical protein